jgi:hypothetical protein
VGQKSSVEKLPKNLREKLLEMLNDPACTQAWIAEAINDEAGEAVLSKSGVNRYAQRMKKFAEKNRQAREVAVVNPLCGFTSGVSLRETPRLDTRGGHAQQTRQSFERADTRRGVRPDVGD